MSKRDIVVCTSVTTQHKCAGRSRIGNIVRFIVPLSALLVVLLSVSTPMTTHAASTRPIPPCSPGEVCGDPTPIELKPCTDAQLIPMHHDKGPGQTSNYVWMFFSQQCQGYWVEVVNVSDQPIQADANVVLRWPSTSNGSQGGQALGDVGSTSVQSGSSSFSHLVTLQDIREAVNLFNEGAYGTPPQPLMNPVSIQGHAETGGETGDQWDSATISVTV